MRQTGLFATAVACAGLAHAGTLTKVTDNWATKQTKVGFYIHVPDKLAANPPIVVNPHWCHGSANATWAGTAWRTYAEQYGFPVIYPDSPNDDQCWDVSSPATLSHGGGGDSGAIIDMVNWTIKKYGANPKRVFAMGISSGGMMTNVLLGAYPDVFAAGSAFAGVPFGCFAAATVDAWSDDCAKGRIVRTGAEWAAIVRAAYPGYNGWRPKLQVHMPQRLAGSSRTDGSVRYMVDHLSLDIPRRPR